MVRNKDKSVETKQQVEVVAPALELIEAKADEAASDDQLEMTFMPVEREKPARLRVVRRHPMI